MKTVQAIVQGLTTDDLRDGLDMVRQQLFNGLVAGEGATERYNFQFTTKEDDSAAAAIPTAV